VGAKLFHADGRTDGRTDRRTDMTKLTVAFRNFTHASKNQHRLITFRYCKDNYLFPKVQTQIWAPRSLLLKGYWESFL